MTLIAREDIIGAHNDIDLYALDGIIRFSANAKSRDELVDLFDRKYPDFRVDHIEFVED